VRVGLSLGLTRSVDHKVLWSAHQSAETALQERGVEAVARAMNAASAQLLRELSPGLIAQVEEDYKASQVQTH